MPKKKQVETQEVQSERFREAIRAAINAGELNPTEADDKFDHLMKVIMPPKAARDKKL